MSSPPVHFILASFLDFLLSFVRGNFPLISARSSLLTSPLGQHSSPGSHSGAYSLGYDRVFYKVNCIFILLTTESAMEATPENFAALSHYLVQTLDPTTQKAAEQSLATVETQPNFPIVLLKLVQNPATEQTVRFAGSIYFKNYVKRHWSPEDGAQDVIAVQDRDAIKTYIVGLMLSVPHGIQMQLGEAVSIIADMDFPDSWEGLIPEILSKISPTDFESNAGLLQVAHSIFKRYRSAMKSNALYIEIKFVIEQFAAPMLSLMQAVDSAIDANAGNAAALQPLFTSLLLLTRIFYDLNFQDLPEWFEDNQKGYMVIFLKYLSYANPVLNTDTDDEIGPIEKVKTAICEVIDLWAKKYEEEFKDCREFVTVTWGMMTSAGTEQKYDLLVSKAIGFLTTVVQSGKNHDLFANPDTLRSICEQVVLPNMMLRESDEELFEDDPIEYIRRDLEGSDTDTRRRAASDLVRGLLEHFAKEVTGIFSTYVSLNLQAYEKNREDNWKAKDTAIYLITSLSARSSTAQMGVTKVNEFMDVLPIFTTHILPELQSPAEGSSHPIIKVDAIKFLMIFRSQLTKDQLSSVFPFLLNHLLSTNYVVYTYAAVCIERVLATKMENGAFQFHEGDIAAVAHPILKHLFDLIEKNGTTPEKLAENDYLMKAAMRIIIVAKHDLEPVAVEMVGRLTRTIEALSKNPSNPKFTHYTFEALAALIRFICARKPALVTEFEALLIPPLVAIIDQQIPEFMPYAFQIMSQMLDFHPVGQVPETYQKMLHSLLMPVLWQSSGNIPALIRLLRSYLCKAPTLFADEKVLQAVLGISQKLIGSKINDHCGFELLCAVFEFIPSQALKAYIRNILTVLLTRMSQQKTSKYTRGFLNFITFTFMLKKEDYDVDVVVGAFDSIQNNPLFSNVLQNILIPELGVMMAPKERKSAIIGFGNLLGQSKIMRTAPYIVIWPNLLSHLVYLCDTPLAQNTSTTEEEELYTFDIEDNAGYSASFSKLTVVGHQDKDLTAAVPDARSFLAQNVLEAVASDPKVREAVNAEMARKFNEYLTAAVPAPLR
ncbi:Cse1-domain-containing protein [Fimicolochytrium jonesii]|uniref:Cse1-domain-containing protein n=1 Tax=Fimicolochytrium jonesii TaxID=1396493 RepID=UPI0022FE43E1|nr:Cse1-domain-containing protein [Fimicolochytrium jonesii]KAI8825582.1 Cse1-domain-containing protein [Fimicolochytrium jonesii]